jgi:uncharacterized protein (DUF488 family)
MLEPAFRAGVDELLATAAAARTAVMCAELLWWRCHRSLLADHLTAVRGVEVVHLEDEAPGTVHRLRREARVDEGRLVYDVGTLPFPGGT